MIVALAMVAMPASSSAQISVGVAVHIGPPPLPVYSQPLCPGPGYLWTPGYWAYGPYGYYWVPGTWVLPPEVGLLWTPGYWGWGDGAYYWHAGYWGPHVGFYGGINYGFGYNGIGFVGGRWMHGVFEYNVAVMHVDRRVIHHVYMDRSVVRGGDRERVSFNGGRGGINARPTAREMEFEHERHFARTERQTEHERSARSDRALRHSVNRGRPPVAATARPRQFSERGVARPTDSRNRPPSTRNGRNNMVVEPRKTERAPARTESRGSNPPRGRQAAPAPRSESRPQTRPQSQGRPKPEAKPRPEGKPHGEGKPHIR